MQMKKVLVFLIALVLFIQPAAVAAAEPDAETAIVKQAETETADENSSAEQATEELHGERAEESETETGIEETKTEETKTEETKTEETKTEETKTEETKTEETVAEEIAAVAENADAAVESRESRIVLELPLLESYGSSPFDFIMDPQGLITMTNAAKYGGARFEAGETLYFRNTDGDYEYSHKSDWLSIVSRSNVPVRVTVELAVKNTDGVDLVQSADFSDDGNCSMYLALLDSDGNETAVDAEGKAVFEMVLPACINEDETAVCSFALTGCCNPDRNWSGMTACPCIVVNWTVEPLVSEEGN